MRWLNEVDLASGETRTVSGSMLKKVTVTLGVDATIDGTAYTHGQVAHIGAGRHKVVASGAEKWVDLRVACTIAVNPTLDCYP